MHATDYQSRTAPRLDMQEVLTLLVSRFLKDCEDWTAKAKKDFCLTHYAHMGLTPTLYSQIEKSYKKGF